MLSKVKCKVYSQWTVLAVILKSVNSVYAERYLLGSLDEEMCVTYSLLCCL